MCPTGYVPLEESVNGKQIVDRQEFFYKDWDCVDDDGALKLVEDRNKEIDGQIFYYAAAKDQLETDRTTVEANDDTPKLI